MPSVDNDTITVEFTLINILTILSLVIFSSVWWYTEGSFAYSYIYSLIMLPIVIGFAILIMCDYKYYILPNPINYFLIFYGVFINWINWGGFHLTDIKQSLIGAFCGIIIPFVLRLLFNRILGRESFGLGDVKMLGAIGAIFGGMFLLNTIFFASLLGILFYFVKRILGAEKGQYIPYGCCLGIICLFPIFN